MKYILSFGAGWSSPAAQRFQGWNFLFIGLKKPVEGQKTRWNIFPTSFTEVHVYSGAISKTRLSRVVNEINGKMIDMIDTVVWTKFKGGKAHTDTQQGQEIFSTIFPQFPPFFVISLKFPRFSAFFSQFLQYFRSFFLFAIWKRRRNGFQPFFWTFLRASRIFFFCCKFAKRFKF